MPAPSEVIATRPTWDEVRSSELWSLADPIEVVRFRANEGTTEVRTTPRSSPETDLAFILDPEAVVVGAALRLPRSWLDSDALAITRAIELSTSFLAFLGSADPPIEQLSQELGLLGRTARHRSTPHDVPPLPDLAQPPLTSVADLLCDPFPGELVVLGLRLLRVNNTFSGGRARFALDWGAAARLPGDTARYRCEACGIEILGEQVQWDGGLWHRLAPVPDAPLPAAAGDVLRWMEQQRPGRHGPVSVLVPPGQDGPDAGAAAERRSLLRMLDTLVPGGITVPVAGGATSRPDPWLRRRAIEGAVVDRFGAGSREHAQALVLAADSSDPAQTTALAYYERAAEVLHRIEGEASAAVAEIYARLSYRRVEAGRRAGGGLASTDVLNAAAAELTLSIEIRERLVDDAPASARRRRHLAALGPSPAVSRGAPEDVSQTQLSRDKQELARLRRLVAYKARPARRSAAGPP